MYKDYLSDQNIIISFAVLLLKPLLNPFSISNFKSSKPLALWILCKTIHLVVVPLISGVYLVLNIFTNSSKFIQINITDTEKIIGLY